MIAQAQPAGVSGAERFRILLIKPSHYDDDGYVIRWLRSMMPSNSLASVYGLAMESVGRGVLSDHAQIDVTPIDETNTRVRIDDIIARVPGARREGLRRPGRRAVQPVPPRARHCAAAARRRHSGGAWRLPCLRPALDVRRADAGPAGRTRHGREPVRRRSGRPHGRHPARCARAANSSRSTITCEDLPGLEGTVTPFLPAQPCHPHHRQHDELRCRPRLPVPVLVLHHHQRAGPQVPPPQPGRRGAHPARELGAGRQPLLHHRRQFRPQQGLGDHLRPHHPAARETTAWTCGS